jgi:hypothetical protein
LDFGKEILQLSGQPECLLHAGEHRVAKNLPTKAKRFTILSLLKF